MKLFRKKVDERQEQELMRIERSAFWVVLAVLGLSLLVQAARPGLTLRDVAGEIATMIIGGVYVMIRYIQKGQWDYFSRPGLKTYFLYSLAAALIIPLVGAVLGLMRGRPLPNVLGIFLFNAVLVFVVCFILLAILGEVTKRRRAKLETQYPED